MFTGPRGELGSQRLHCQLLQLHCAASSLPGSSTTRAPPCCPPTVTTKCEFLTGGCSSLTPGGGFINHTAEWQINALACWHCAFHIFSSEASVFFFSPFMWVNTDTTQLQKETMMGRTYWQLTQVSSRTQKHYVAAVQMCATITEPFLAR